MRYRCPLAALASAVLLAAPPADSLAQLRIVSFNTSNSATVTGTPRVGMGTILSAIGASISDDPTLPGNTGIATPIDVLCIQEARSSALTAVSYANLLNSTYGTTTFSAGTLDGATTGSGTQVIVYNSATVQLISQAAVGTASTSGQPRQTIRNQLRPVGYGSGADVFIYNAHWKAGTAGSDETRRLAEANAIRGDLNDNVPAGANVMTVGDFNITGSSDDSYVAITAPGNGQMFDPIGEPGSWRDNLEFQNIHTQSPWGSKVNPGNGFTGTAGGVDDRFDFQVASANVLDGRGTAYIPNSYQAFGNNGSHLIGAPINTGSGADASTLFYLASIVDHLPIVADYQVPARVGVAVAPVPSVVIEGASVPVGVTITNSASVTFANGADTLDYSVAGAGSVTGSAGGSNLHALAPGNEHGLSIDTSGPGLRSGSVEVTSSSEAVANASSSTPISTTVLAHATPTFDAGSEVNVATIDFGIRGRTLGSATAGFSVANLAHPSGFTAALDLDSVSGTGGTAALTTSAAPFANLPAGASSGFTATLSDAANGSFSATYTFNLSDENLPGASARGPLTLVLTGTVATPGDADLNDVIDFDDYVLTDAGYNGGLGGWGNGDFDGNGLVDFDDYVLIDFFYNQQGGGRTALIRAMNYLTGEDRSSAGLGTPGMQAVLAHFDRFGIPYASAFVSAVPEPAAAALALFVPALTRRRRSR